MHLPPSVGGCGSTESRAPFGVWRVTVILTGTAEPTTKRKRKAGVIKEEKMSVCAHARERERERERDGLDATDARPLQ